MRKNIQRVIFFVFIVVLAAFIYTYKLAYIPNGVYVDEAVVGYNAYSILTTGRDAFGQAYPVLFRLLESYTPPLYIYTSVLFIKLFGMNIFSLRLISVISVLVSVIFFYLFIKKLDLFKSKNTYLIITLFYAISPWLVFNARLGYEVTLAYLLFNIGIYFLFLALEKPQNYLWASVFLSLATYTAHTQRFLVPIFCFLFLVLFARKIFIKRNVKYLLATVLILLIIQIPHFTVINTPAFWVKNQRLTEPGIQRIFNNISGQTFSYLSTTNLFYKLSDIDLQHTIPGISVMYDWMVVPFLIGFLWMLLRRKENNIRFLLLLFFTSLMPAVLSGEFISIQRALPFLLPLAAVIGIGMDKIISRLSSFLTFLIFTFLFLYSLLMLYRSYFVLFPIERAEGWNYGYSQVSKYLRENPEEQYLIDNNRNPRNYILLLYYLQYPPQNYQNEVDAKYKADYYRSLPPENSYHFSNIEVREIDWKMDSYKNQIIIGDPLSISELQAKDHYLKEIYEVDNPKGDPILIFYKTNPEKKCKTSPNPDFCLRG